MAGLLLMLSGAPAPAHAPFTDGFLTDWCVGAQTNISARTNDSYLDLTCGKCSLDNNACVLASDCSQFPNVQTCNPTAPPREETGFYDARGDGAVNDLATIVTTEDPTSLYFGAELWVDPDPNSLPQAQIAIDVQPGGITTWLDPQARLRTPGNCSTSVDRACTSNIDCHFCAISKEPFSLTRVRACGSDDLAFGGTGSCSTVPGDVCQTSQTCLNLGTGPAAPNMGLDTQGAPIGAEYLISFDFGRWLIGLTDVAQLYRASGASWVPVNAYLPGVNPGFSGGSGGPPGGVELRIPWADFNCAGCAPFVPGQAFTWTLMIARDRSDLDYFPFAAVEDVLSEVVAGQETRSRDSCPSGVIQATACEIADGTTDSWVPPLAPPPGGAITKLMLSKNAAPSITLTWDPSCSSADTDYEIYEGTIGSWYSHTNPASGAICSTAGQTTRTFNAAPGDTYYLVVPSNSATEGSYGRDRTLAGATNERPVAAAACRARVLGNCP